MVAADLPTVGAIARIVHPDHPERDAVFAERLALWPSGCFLTEDDGGPVGYLISHPWPLGRAAPLDTLLHRIPATDGSYLHDLALLPAARGTGLGTRGVAMAVTAARNAGATAMGLVAVSGSTPFWQRQGFAPPLPREACPDLTSYGGAATYLLCRL